MSVLDYTYKKDLVDPEVLSRLRERSDFKAALQTASHFGAIVLTGTLLYLFWPAWWSILIFAAHGVLLNFLYAAQHELMHNTVYKSKFLNEFFSRITGILVIYPREHDRLLHFAHHRNTNIPGKDPELSFGEDCARPVTRNEMIWLLTGIDYWYRMAKSLSRHCMGNTNECYWLTDKQRITIVREARWHLAFYALLIAISVVFKTWLIFLLWFAPLILMKGAHHIQNIVEHAGLPLYNNIQRNTRTIYVNPIHRWLAWNMQYHADHHLFTAVPFYNLPALHEHLRDKIDNVEKGYFGAIKSILTNWRTDDIPETAQ